VEDIRDAAQEFVEKIDDARAEPEPAEAGPSQPTQTPEERAKKMAQLRKRMLESSHANRSAVINEATTAKITVKEAARLEKQRKLAEMLRSKAQAEEEGRDQDEEREKNWQYSIEENDAWEKRMKRKKARADFEFHDDVTQARRKYKKDLDLLKPDLVAYNRQKEIAMGFAPGTLVKTGESGSKALVPTSQQQQLAAESLYRDANTLIYADNKPSEEAVDRVVSKINGDLDKKNKFSRKRANEDEGDITYINERNRVFNKKIARYYDKYTTEIRASFERGTAI
ncbi:SYF2-domain-containing protein, partial [Sistotremastrum suecicum HHB10207 ss-3]